MTALVPTSFNYGALTALDLDVVRSAETDIRSRHQRMSDDALTIGRELTRAKSVLPHGSFEPWIAATFTFSSSTALNFMRLSDAFGDKPTTIADLPLSILYRAAAANITSEERELLFVPAEGGGSPTGTDIADRLADLRACKRQREREEREAAKDTPDRRRRERLRREKERREREDARKHNDERDERECKATFDLARMLLRLIPSDESDEFYRLWHASARLTDIPAVMASVERGQFDPEPYDEAAEGGD